MMNKTLLVTMLAGTMALTACTESMNDMGNKQMIGAGTGAVLGAVVGSKVGKGTGQLVGVAAGTLLGGFLGNEIGKSLDKADLAYAQQAENKAHSAPMNETIKWENPESGHYGYVTPVNQGRSADGRYCREYQQTIYIDGRAQTANGRACQNPDGTWQVVQ